MKHYKKNPRKITKKQFSQLAEWLEELGDLGGIVHDLNTDEVIGGNQRLEAMGLMQAKPVITETFDEPTKQGTVALGYFEHAGERFTYRAVRWDERQCEKANIIANKAGGDFDFDILANEFEFADLLEWGFEEHELLGFDDGNEAQSPDDFKEYDEQIDTDYQCPKCGYKWSGKQNLKQDGEGDADFR